MAHRKWKEAKQLPDTAGPGNMLGCSLVSFHFLWAILCLQAVEGHLGIPKTVILIILSSVILSGRLCIPRTLLAMLRTIQRHMASSYTDVACVGSFLHSVRSINVRGTGREQRTPPHEYPERPADVNGRPSPCYCQGSRDAR